MMKNKTKISEVKLDVSKGDTEYTMVLQRSCVLFNDDFPFVVEFIEDISDVTSLTLFLKGYDNEFQDAKITKITVLGPKKLLKPRKSKVLDLKYSYQSMRIKRERGYTMIGVRWDNGKYFSYFGF